MLKESLCITVDVVKQGFGSTNDGNTARKFFSNPEIVSQVTGVDTELINYFSVILQVNVLYNYLLFHSNSSSQQIQFSYYTTNNIVFN